MENETLYSKFNADALTKSEQTESWRLETDRLKVEMILKYANGIQSFLDIGCAWGQILKQLVGRFPTLVGVDESKDRIEQLAANNEGIQTMVCSAKKLDLADEMFEGVLTSHVIHEIKLFGNDDDLQCVLAEIKRVLKPGGQYFMIDHLDPGSEEVIIELPEDKRKLLEEFVMQFQYRQVNVKFNGNQAILDRRDCHDFVTKIWSMHGGAKDLEMKETHTIMKKGELFDDIKRAGFMIDHWVPFNPIIKLMNFYGIRLVKGDSWNRQLMLVSRKRG